MMAARLLFSRLTTTAALLFFTCAVLKLVSIERRCVDCKSKCFCPSESQFQDRSNFARPSGALSIALDKGPDETGPLNPLAARRARLNITRFCVYGERTSGTNWLQQTLVQNFPSHTRNRRGSLPDCYSGKHFFLSPEMVLPKFTVSCSLSQKLVINADLLALLLQ